MSETIASGTITQEISIRGSANAIFEALTDPAQRMAWWGSEDRFRVTHMEHDLRPGGKWRMSGEGFGKPFEVHGEYRNIDRPRVLAFTWLPDWQGDATESLVRFDLDEKDALTTVRLTHSGLSEKAHAAHKGWPQILGWLQGYVERAA